MTKIHFLRNFNGLREASEKLLAGKFVPKKEIIVKIHFGEPGNKTALFPEDVAPIIETLKSFGLKPILLDTPVAYNSKRATKEGYEEVVKEREWDKLADFVISDNYKEIKMKDFTAQVARELVEAENVLVISHVKGHTCAGFGGAIKNLGMGGVSPVTKGMEHGLCKPMMKGGCIGCGLCVSQCPAEALKLVEGKAKLVGDCWGCSICQYNCPQKCWQPQKAYFDDLLAQGAAASINNFPKNTYYINIIKNITKKCDCETDSGEIVAADEGILFGDNPVALDQASIDLINKTAGKEVFLEANFKDPKCQINYAAEYTKFEKDYELVLLQ